MKSFAYPYVYTRHDTIYVMRDGVGDKPRRITRKAEVVAYDVAPEVVAEFCKTQDFGRYFISHIGGEAEPNLEIRSAYKSLGYRTLLAEEMFVHATDEIPDYESKPKVRRVVSMTDSDQIKRLRRNRKAIRDVDLREEGAEHRLYAVIDGIRACGWVGSVPFGDKSWIADLYVLPEYRGRGYGRALMSAVTREDREFGVRESVLLASAAGARLYPHIGYQTIGTLQLFCPRR